MCITDFTKSLCNSVFFIKMLGSNKILRQAVMFRSFQYSTHSTNVLNGSVLKSNIDVNSKEYQVILYIDTHLYFST